MLATILKFKNNFVLVIVPNYNVQILRFKKAYGINSHTFTPQMVPIYFLIIFKTNSFISLDMLRLSNFNKTLAMFIQNFTFNTIALYLFPLI